MGFLDLPPSTATGIAANTNTDAARKLQRSAKACLRWDILTRTDDNEGRMNGLVRQIAESRQACRLSKEHVRPTQKIQLRISAGHNDYTLAVPSSNTQQKTTSLFHTSVLLIGDKDTWWHCIFYYFSLGTPCVRAARPEGGLVNKTAENDKRAPCKEQALHTCCTHYCWDWFSWLCLLPATNTEQEWQFWCYLFCECLLPSRVLDWTHDPRNVHEVRPLR